MTHGSLFSGIGGFDLAAEWMGWENKFHCEWNEFGQKVLYHYWPEAELFTDITKSDFTKYANKIDILTGGFPCQPYSTAGKRLGKEDERHLWPEMLRVISEIKPSWIVGENVRGLVNWNGGMVFHEVQSDLENQGYEVQPFLIPAAGVNAPHQRYRIWFVAHTKTDGCELQQTFDKWEKCKQERNNIRTISESDGNEWDASNSNSGGLERSAKVRWNSEHVIGEDSITLQKRDASNSESTGFKTWFKGSGEKQFRRGNFRNGIPTDWKNFPTVTPICNGDDGLSSKLDSITFPKWRRESIKAGGNAIVPQVALQIFKAIQEYENITRNSKGNNPYSCKEA